MSEESNVEVLAEIPDLPLTSILEHAVANLNPEVPQDDVLALHDRLQFYSRELKRLLDTCEEKMIEWIKSNGKDLVVSPEVRYYVGISKSTRCTDLPRAVEAILESAGGDFELFCQALSANAIKYGHARKVLDPEVYDRLFITEARDKLEEGAPPKPKLLKADARFRK